MISVLKLNDKIYDLPVNFSQVREDCLLDSEILQNINCQVNVLMIASGGDTLCYLAAHPKVKHIDAVDASTSQLNLTKIKLALLNFSQENRLAILGHSEMSPEIRMQILTEICRENKIDISSLRAADLISMEGPDFCGRYEQLFKGIQKELELKGITRNNLKAKRIGLLNIFREYFDMSLLIRLFGREATQNPLKSFSEHFHDQTEAYLNVDGALKSPYLNQMLFGEFAGICYPWLELKALTAREVCSVDFSQGMMLDKLKSTKSESYEFIHLSNILDWLSEEEAGEVLYQTFRCLKKGGKCIIRQLNSSLNIEGQCKEIIWNRQWSEQLTEKDRSFFYRKVLVGEKA